MKALISTLSSEQIKRIEQRMYPAIQSSIQDELPDAYAVGNQSILGFLDDHQSLITVIENDSLTLRRYQIEPEQIANRLETIVGKALRIQDLYYRGDIELTEQEYLSLGRGGKDGVLIEDKFRFSSLHARGVQNCPFEDSEGSICNESSYGYIDCLLQNTSNGFRLQFPGLIIHLIRDHHFFEGSRKYRVDPEQLLKLLELEPGQDYSPHFSEEILWQGIEAGGGSLDNYDWNWRGKEWKRVLDSPEETLELSKKAKLYRAGERCILVAEEACKLPEPVFIGGIMWGARVHKGYEFYIPRKNTFIPL